MVALVRGLRGLRGQVRIELLTDRPEDRFAPGTVLFPEGTAERLTIAESSPVADGLGWFLRFAEVPDRSAAERLREVYLEVEPAADEPREPGRWLWHELEGLAVRASTGEDLGKIAEIYRAGGAEVFVVRGPRGELDVPGVNGIVLDLAPERGEMIVDLEALALDARPVDDEDYVRPRDRRPKKQVKPPKGPSQPPPGTRPVQKPGQKLRKPNVAVQPVASAPAAPLSAATEAAMAAAMEPDAKPKRRKPAADVKPKRRKPAASAEAAGPGPAGTLPVEAPDA